MSTLVDYFIPQQLSREGFQRRQARVAILAVFALLGWGPIASTLYYFGGSPPAMWAVVAATITSLLTPFLLKWTGSLHLAGNFLILTLYALFVWLSMLFGGLEAPPVTWILLMPLFAMLFLNARSALVWMGVALATWSTLILTQLLDITLPFASTFNPSLQIAHRAVGVIGLSCTVFAVMLLKDHIQRWLVATVEETAAEARAVLQTAPDGILTLDLDGRVLNANDAAGRLFGHTREELKHRSIDELIVSLDATHVRNAPLGNNEEHSALDAHNRVFPAEIAYGSLQSTGRQGVVLILRDITERKEADQALRDARDLAIDANLAKSTFLANMSHELRTPLNAVIGYSEMIMEEIQLMGSEDALSDRERVEAFIPDLRRIRTAGKHLLMLISDILDLSKIEAGKMTTHPETFNTAALLTEICDTARPLAAKNLNTLHADFPDDLGTMHSDPTRVRQILFNLLSNASKFTHEGHIYLRATRCDDNRHIRFEVKDTGIGMDAEQLHRVFDPFTQADTSTTRKFGGTGLGLTITRHFCELLGGDIVMTSAPGEGTQVSVRLALDLTPSPNLATHNLPA
ncbi:sensor histidine kinase [Lujinxingia litoralis]|nr:ATP-binding protein [Lujinxingia litoralis]